MEIRKCKVMIDRQNKWFECDAKTFDIKKGDVIIVDSGRCLESARVLTEPVLTETTENEQLVFMMRHQTSADTENIKINLVKEEEIRTKTRDLVFNLKLDMKISDVLLSVDSSKVIISFTAEDRVDFRDLVRELANMFKIRIELKQIGTRDEVKLIGALGACGRPCCCSSTFNEFCHVSIKMAKTQNLSLNPNNISGVCGRLMCCLAFENEHYNETLALMPKVNTTVITPDGKGIAIYNNLLKKLVSVKFLDEDNTFKEVKIYDLDVVDFDRPAKDLVENA